MLVKFPDFQKINLDDRDSVEEITRRFEPYSDFNFTSLWTYNSTGELKLSQLNGNFVIEMPDYLTGKPMLSVLGTASVNDTISELLNYAGQHGFDKQLKLVPEITIGHIQGQHDFEITEDEDNHDYILSVAEVAAFAGKKYYDKRNLVNRFNKAHPVHNLLDLDLTNPSVHIEINHIFDVWAAHSAQSQEESATERTAIERLLASAGVLDVKGLGCYVDNELVGFTTYEKAFHGYGFISFEKADRQFPGLYAVLNHETAKRLDSLGCEFINFEQDMGLPGLKAAKKLWRPIKFLKKYTISPKAG